MNQEVGATRYGTTPYRADTAVSKDEIPQYRRWAILAIWVEGGQVFRTEPLQPPLHDEDGHGLLLSETTPCPGRVSARTGFSVASAGRPVIGGNPEGDTYLHPEYVCPSVLVPMC
jgi:hypothetical protein